MADENSEAPDTSDVSGQAPSDDSSTQASAPPETGAGQPETGSQGQQPSIADWQSLGNFEEVKEALNHARLWQKRAQDNKQKADEYDRLDEQNKTEAQKATERAEKAEQSYAAAIEAAVRGEVKAAASGWADPDDAPRYLDNLATYVADDGSVDTKGIRKDVDAALKQRPYLAKQDAGTGQAGHGMSPDPGQGSRGGSVNDQIAEAESNGDVRTSLALKAQQMLNNR